MVAANLADLGFALQSAKGSPASASAYRTYLAGGRQVGQMRTQADFEETTGQRMRTDSYVSEAHVDGSPQLFVMAGMIAPIMYGVLGAVSTSGSGDPYTHTFTPATTLPYFTFWRWLADLLYEEADDCKITQVVLHGESGKRTDDHPDRPGPDPDGADGARDDGRGRGSRTLPALRRLGRAEARGDRCGDIRSFDLTINNNGQIIPGDSLTPYDVAETLLEVTCRTTQLVTARACGTGSTTARPPRARTTRLPRTCSSWADRRPVSTSSGRGRRAAERSLEILIRAWWRSRSTLSRQTGPTPLEQDVTYRAFQPSSGAAITAKILNGAATVAL